MIAVVTGSSAPSVDRKEALTKAREALLNLLGLNGGYRPADSEYERINEMVEFIEEKLGIN